MLHRSMSILSCNLALGRTGFQTLDQFKPLLMVDNTHYLHWLGRPLERLLT